MNHHQEPTRQALRGADVEIWVKSCGSPRRTCGELGVCQNRMPSCAGCTVQQQDSWTALCHWLARKFKT